MSSVKANRASRQKMQQILAASGSRTIQDNSNIEVSQYNWNQPHYFTSDQITKLQGFAKNVAAAITEKFNALYHDGSFNVTVTSITQHFAKEFLNPAPDSPQNDYYLAFGIDQNSPCGFIGVPPKTATAWTTQLLGDSEPESEKNLSKLEESLLLDIASEIIEAIKNSHNIYDFQPAKNILKNKFPLSLEDSEEICKVAFTVQKNQADTLQAYFLILCEKLAPVVGKIDQATEKFSYQDISKAILDNLHKVQVTVSSKLASTTLTFEETMGLQQGDIVLLGEKIDKPIELIIEGKTIFKGQLAKSNGKYAVLITKVC
jgi:flagellar motor switch protein FliM